MFQYDTYLFDITYYLHIVLYASDPISIGTNHQKIT
jgi:hypothetical protein